jgi:hypothetical protein
MVIVLYIQVYLLEEHYTFKDIHHKCYFVQRFNIIIITSTIGNNIHLLTGMRLKASWLFTETVAIARGKSKDNSWFRGNSKLVIIKISKLITDQYNWL